MICECVLHPVRQMEATDTWKSGRVGRRGGDLLFLETVFSWCPRGEGRCGLPSSDGSAGETCKRRAAEDVSHRRVNRSIRICNCNTFSINQQIQEAEV